MSVNAEKVAEPKITRQPNWLFQRGRTPWLLATLALTSFFLITNRKVIKGTEFPVWDARSFYAPEFTLIADHVRAGHILLWNPWVSAGSPDYADPQIGAVSPIMLMTAAITGGTERGFVTYWLLVWLLGPVGVMILARYFGSPPWTALAISLGYAFCGFYIGHAEHTDFVYAFSFLPFLIWRFDTALTSGRLRPAVEAGALWGMCALGGYPEMSILNGTFLALWALGRCCFTSPDAPIPGNRTHRFGFAGVGLAMALAMGLLVLSPTYYAFFKEGAGYTDRTGPLPREYAISSNELEPGTLTTFVSPYLHKIKYPGLNPGLWPKSDVSVMGNYMGAIPFVLAVLAIVARPREKWRWWLFGLALFALACALGDYLPVRGWLYNLYLPSRYFRHPGAFRGYATFFAAVLAILAARDLALATRQQSSGIWERLLYVSAGAAVVAAVSYHIVIAHVIHLNGLPLAARLGDLHLGNRHLFMVWGGVVLVSLVAAIRDDGKKWLPFLFCLVALADASLTMRISQRTVADSAFRTAWERVYAGHKTNLSLRSLQRERRAPDWSSPLSNENVTLRMPVAFDSPTPLMNRFHLDFAMHPVLVNMSTGADRIWFSPEVVEATPSDDSYSAFVKRSEALGAPVLVVHQPSAMTHALAPGTQDSTSVSAAISQLPAAQRVKTAVLSYSPNELDLNVNCPSPGWVLVTDRWSQGWRSIVNGQPGSVFGGDFVFRAVRVKAGENTIRFYYRPAGWPWLVLLSWIALLIVFAPPLLQGLKRNVRRASIV